MITGSDIVCISTTDWDEVWGSRQQIMSVLAPRNHVFFVERQVGPEHLYKYPLLRGKRSLPEIREKDGVTLLRPPLMLPGRYYSRMADSLSQNRLIAWLKKKLDDLEVKDPILWMYPPNSHLLPGSLGERVSVYHCIDRFAAQSSGRKKRIILDEERATLESVDVCLAYSRSVCESHSRYCSGTVFWPNGCDYDRIRSTMEQHSSEPADLAAIPHPRLGHMGSIAGKTDLALIESLSAQHPGWQFVFVGAEYPHDLDMELWTQIKARENVHYLGAKSIADVPVYEKGFDVCLVLWQVNEWTLDLQPIKIFEYLATGKPVISPALPELDYLKDGIVFADGLDEFEERCRMAIEGKHPVSKESQLSLAANYAWPRRLAEAAAIIEGIEGR